MTSPVKQLEKDSLTLQLKREKAEADTLFMSIGEGAFVTDSHGRISKVNKPAIDILGFSKRELIGKWYPDTVVAEDSHGQIIPKINRPITQVFLTGQTITSRIYYRRKDGSRVPVSLSVAPVLKGSKPVGAIEVFRDITQELTLEQAKDDFIAVSSHQLRTPATAVKQYIGMLIDGFAGKLSRDQQKLLRRAYDSNERQLKIIEDLLQVARVDAGNIALYLETSDLILLLKDVVREQLSKIHSRNQTISLESQHSSILVLMDQARMRMVFENLVDNAIKYTPPRKKITVRITRKRAKVVVEVMDEGVGISADDIDKLFQKFSRIPNDLSVEAGGTGLGLYWAERIVKLHHGKIEITSTPKKGSSFNVSLPLIIKNHTDKI